MIQSSQHQHQRQQAVSTVRETYIETIADLLRLKGRARIRDIANKLGVAPPSASEVVASLRRNGMVSGGPWQAIGLTAAGRRVAERLGRRQAALVRFMVEVMAIRAAEADAIACRIEHHVDPTFVNRLLKLAQFLGSHSPDALKAFASQASPRKARAPAARG